MDEETKLMEGFVEAEYQASVIRYAKAIPVADALKSDYAAAVLKASRMWRLKDQGGVPFLPIYDEMTEAHLQQRDRLLKRRIFKASRYDLPALGRVVLFAVGNTDNRYACDSYFQRFGVGETDKGMRIMSDYSVCVDCCGVGCQTCAGGWIFVRGRVIKLLGEPLEIHRLDEVEDEKYAAAHALDV